MGMLLAALATVSTSPALAQVPVPETSGPSAQAVVAGRLLDPMFQDHAVLQRDRPIRVWGTARPGRRVHVRLDAQGATGRADRSGRWEVQLPALSAGGPHVLTATDGTSSQSVDDLLAGDVWLCAGQSNMELPVWRSLDAASELSNARAPTVRLLTVPQTASAVPLDALAGDARWQAVDEDSLREFSAACFYFARALQTRVDVPMGLVDASWGGSRIEAWIGADALQDAPRFREPLDVLALYHRDPALAAQRWGEAWGRWWDRRAGTIPGDRPWRMTGSASPGWRKAPDALGAWERWNEPALAAFDGMVWFRTTVALTAEQAHQPAVLELGAIDETDMTWVN
ncbi:MAG TPA: 9-O-acetylesterase, partial [Luteimonas sp.]|nr:9-O-acetylesterase [Luteimonas sp.]